MEKKFYVVREITNCYHMSDDDKLTLIMSYLLGRTDEETALRAVKGNNCLTRKDITEYKEAHGAMAAADLLILGGPDAFIGPYAEYVAIVDELEAEAEREEGAHHDPA